MADLGKVLKDLRHNLTLAEKVRIALKVAKGMEELHRAGILHCDLKCKNILVRRTPAARTAPHPPTSQCRDVQVFETNPWKIKLNDFGLSTQYKVAHCAKAPSSDATMYFPCTAPEGKLKRFTHRQSLIFRAHRVCRVSSCVSCAWCCVVKCWRISLLV